MDVDKKILKFKGNGKDLEKLQQFWERGQDFTPLNFKKLQDDSGGVVLV